jgi:hypothetical protein
MILSFHIPGRNLIDAMLRMTAYDDTSNATTTISQIMHGKTQLKSTQAAT